MSILGISLFINEHVQVATGERHLEWSCCVKTCLWLIAKRYREGPRSIGRGTV